MRGLIIAEHILRPTTRSLSIRRKYSGLPGKEDDMKCKNFIAIAVCALLVAFSGIAYSAERGTDEEAMAMVEMAGKLIEEQGDLALPVISNPEGRFYNKEKDLYVFVYNDKFEVVANPYRPELIGVRFPEYSPLAKIVTTSLTEGCCWLKYTDRECCEEAPHVMKTYGKLYKFESKDYIVCCSVR
jgi:hypothetical protein